MSAGHTPDGPNTPDVAAIAAVLEKAGEAMAVIATGDVDAADDALLTMWSAMTKVWSTPTLRDIRSLLTAELHDRGEET